jgi:hypothetical protein
VQSTIGTSKHLMSTLHMLNHECSPSCYNHRPANLQLSYKSLQVVTRETITSTSDVQPLPHPPRLHINPSLTTSHTGTHRGGCKRIISLPVRIPNNPLEAESIKSRETCPTYNGGPACTATTTRTSAPESRASDVTGQDV